MMKNLLISISLFPIWCALVLGTIFLCGVEFIGLSRLAWKSSTQESYQILKVLLLELVYSVRVKEREKNSATKGWSSIRVL